MTSKPFLKPRITGSRFADGAITPVESQNYDVVVRIDELKLLKRGWLDGKGEALDPQQLDWVVDAFKSFYPDQAKLPYLFPTPEGNLLAEWSLDRNSVSLEIDLNNRSAEWHVLNLVTNEEETTQFDLNVPDSWKTIADILRVTL